MTATPAPETAASSTEPPADPGDVPQPLSAFVQGVLTVHFDQGAVVTRKTAQADARSFLEKQNDSENSDRVTWKSGHWFCWASDRVAFASFDADADQNWKLTPDERRRLTENGHAHGVIGSLLRLWESRGRRDEPSYSIKAVVALHQFALDADRTTWESAARLFEGASGAAQVAKAWDDQLLPDVEDAVDNGPVDGNSQEASDENHHGAPRMEDLDIAEPPPMTQSEQVGEDDRSSDADHE